MAAEQSCSYARQVGGLELKDMSISTTVKGIQDIMRQDAGVDGDAQRISQLVWLLFLKIFEDREQKLRQLYASPT